MRPDERVALTRTWRRRPQATIPPTKPARVVRKNKTRCRDRRRSAATGRAAQARYRQSPIAGGAARKSRRNATDHLPMTARGATPGRQQAPTLRRALLDCDVVPWARSPRSRAWPIAYATRTAQAEARAAIGTAGSGSAGGRDLGVGIAQPDRPVENELCRRAVGVGAEIALAFKLNRLARIALGQRGF